MQAQASFVRRAVFNITAQQGHCILMMNDIYSFIQYTVYSLQYTVIYDTVYIRVYNIVQVMIFVMCCEGVRKKARNVGKSEQMM